MTPPPPSSTLFPYTTLFRSQTATSQPLGRSTHHRRTIPRTARLEAGQRGQQAAELLSTGARRSEEHTSELQSHSDLVCRLLLEKKKKNEKTQYRTRRKKADV